MGEDEMKRRLIVAYGEQFINIPCDMIDQDANFLYGYLDERLIAIISIGTFDRAYLSEVKE